MPTNITVVTVSFIKSFFFNHYFLRPRYFCNWPWPTLLAILFVGLGGGWGGVYWPSNGSRNPSPWARVFFNPNLWIINFDYQKCYEVINGAFMRFCPCGHGAILARIKLNLKGDAWPASVFVRKSAQDSKQGSTAIDDHGFAPPLNFNLLTWLMIFLGVVVLVERALIIDYSGVRRGFLTGEPIGRKKYTKLLPQQKLFSPPGSVHSGLGGVRRVV